MNNNENNKLFNFVTIDHSDHDILKQKAKTLEFPLSTENKKFISDFTDFFKTIDGAGLAAPQVGKSLQVFIFHIPEDAYTKRNDIQEAIPMTVFINPSYTPLPEEGTSVDWEGCFSIPNMMGEVERYTAVKYQAYTPDGKKVEGIARGYFARILQHEIGHLNGELYTDLIKPPLRYGPIDEFI